MLCLLEDAASRIYVTERLRIMRNYTVTHYCQGIFATLLRYRILRRNEPSLFRFRPRDSGAEWWFRANEAAGWRQQQLR